MQSAIDFFLAMIGARPIEWAAVALGVVNVSLLIRRSIWNYPFGLVMVSLYAWIFFDAKLYGQAALQPIYFAVQVYGLLHWLGRRDEAGLVVVRELNKSQTVVVTGVILASAIVFGFLMDNYTDAAAPYADGLIAAIFIGAQLLLANRFLQNWLLWIIGDIFAIGLYWSQGLEPTATLYVVFLVLSTLGFFEWRKALSQTGSVTA